MGRSGLAKSESDKRKEMYPLNSVERRGENARRIPKTVDFNAEREHLTERTTVTGWC